MVMIKYLCGVCGKDFSTKEEAEKCEVQGSPNPKFKVGDRRLLTSNYHPPEHFRITKVTIMKVSHRILYSMAEVGKGRWPPKMTKSAKWVEEETTQDEGVWENLRLL